MRINKASELVGKLEKRGLTTLAEQAQSYDRHFTHPLNIIALVFVCAFVVGGAVTAYELFAYGAFKLMNKAAPDVASTDARTRPSNNGAP